MFCVAVSMMMKQQLYNAITEWGLNIKDVIALISDSASNMNPLNEKIMSQTTIHHHYCADHILQLSAIEAFSGNTSTMEAIKKLKTLVTLLQITFNVDKVSQMSENDKSNSQIIKAACRCKTRWWSTYAMVERCLRLHPALERIFREEVMNHVSPD
jgi:hypothetical protein